MENLFGGGIACIIGVIAILAFIFLANAIRIVPEYQRLVVFRLGRSIGPRGPGIVLLFQVVDRAVKVDLREQVREVPHQTSITKDNAPISIDFLWYYKVVDPAESVLQAASPLLAVTGSMRGEGPSVAARALDSQVQPCAEAEAGSARISRKRTTTGTAARQGPG